MKLLVLVAPLPWAILFGFYCRHNYLLGFGSGTILTLGNEVPGFGFLYKELF